MDLNALDRYITGNYGEDQYEDVTCPRHGGDWGDDETCPNCTDADGNALPYEEPEDDRDFDSMPGGWDYEEPDDSWLDSYWETE